MTDYFQREEMPGVQFFRCERYSATLSVPSCAAMWREGNHKNLEHRQRCKTCSVGACHAGEATASMSPLMGACICARCHRTASRLIGKHLCISCQNRQYEWVKGRNARGVAPVNMDPLDARSITYAAGSDVRTLRIALTADSTELVVAALRDSKQRVAIGFRGRPAGQLVQGRLF